MADQLPDPPVPIDADLRDFPFMPLEIGRLFGSAFHARANDAEWRAGVSLWLKSYHQVPAGSLPEDDIELCRLAELGRDLRTWRKIKPMALHGWAKHADGRLYHATVTEKVLEGWHRKEVQRERSRKGNAKRWGASSPGDDEGRVPEGRQATEGEQTALQASARGGSKERRATPQGKQISPQGDAHALPQEVQQDIQQGSLIDPKGQGEREGEGEENPSQAEASSPVAANATAASAADEPGGDSLEIPNFLRRKPPSRLIDDAFTAWLAVAYDLRIPDPGFANADRRKLIAERLAECGPEGWQRALDNLRAADWLRDDDDPTKPKRWVNLANLLKPENFTGLLEGRYAERHDPKPGTGLNANLAALAELAGESPG